MRRVLRVVLRLYPRWWRHRYGDELAALVDDAGATWTTVVDIAVSALAARLQRRPLVEAGPSADVRALFCSPSGLAPVVMSIGALAAIGGHLLTSGPAPQPDEGTAAHLWQLMMAGQLPVVAFFALRWIPTRGWRAFVVSTIHVSAIAAALFPVWWLSW